MEKTLAPVTFSSEQFDKLLGSLFTKKEAENFATKDDLKREISKCATKDDLKLEISKCATKDDLKREISKCATKDDLKNFATKDDLKLYATKDDLKQEIDSLATIIKESFADVYKRFDKNDADHAKNKLDHEEFLTAFRWGRREIDRLENDVNNHEMRIYRLEHKRQ